jgi:hypothetical protein
MAEDAEDDVPNLFSEDEAEAFAAVPAKSHKKIVKTKPEAKSNATAKIACMVPSCDLPRHNRTRVCKLHQRSAQGLCYQVDRCENIETIANFYEKYKDDTWAGQEVEHYAQENPPTAKYARKKLIDIARYRRTQGIRTMKGSREQDVPMTWEEFMHWATDKKRVPEDEAKEWWNELKANPHVARDNGGRSGRLQLWVPNADKCSFRGSERFAEHAVDEESKNGKPAEVGVLIEHLDRQDNTQAHGFLASGPGSQPLKKRYLDEIEKKKIDGDLPVPKRICLEREIPKLGPKMEMDLSGVKTKLEKAMVVCDKAILVLSSCTHEVTDKSSHMYKSTLQHRMQVAHRWLGSPTVVLIGQSLASDAAASSNPVPVPDVAAAVADGDVPVALPPTYPDVSPCSTSTEHLSEASFRMVFAASEPAAIQAYKQRVEKMTLTQLFEIPGHGVPFSGPLASFQTYSALDKIQQDLFEVSDGVVFVKIKADWNESIKTIKEFSAHLSKAANDVISHVKALDTKRRQDENRGRKEKEQVEIKRVKDEAKQSADDIRAKGAAKPAVRSSLFTLDWPADTIPAVQTHAGDVAGRCFGHSLPWVNVDSDKGKLWITTDKLQQSLTNFAGQYKTSQGAKTTGRCQHPIVAKHGLEASLAFFSSFMTGDILDISSIGGGTSFMESLWVYGIVPGSDKLLMPPNCGAMFKYQVSGTVDILFIDMVSLASVIASKSLQSYGRLDEYLETIEKWDKDTMAKLLTDGVKMLQHKLCKNEMLYIPMGWIIVEKAAPDEVLNYGVRKSFMTKHPASKTAYGLCRTLFAAAGRNIDRMNEIHTLME